MMRLGRGLAGLLQSKSRGCTVRIIIISDNILNGVIIVNLKFIEFYENEFVLN